MTPAQAALLGAALDRLLPAGHGLPSASEAQVIVYIDRQVSDPRYAGVARALKAGLRNLDRVCQRDHRRGFALADEASQDDVLLRFQTGKAGVRGFDTRRFFDLLMTLALEGYMGHPVHGGNAGAVAWRSVGIEWPATLGTHRRRGHP